MLSAFIVLVVFLLVRFAVPKAYRKWWVYLITFVAILFIPYIVFLVITNF